MQNAQRILDNQKEKMNQAKGSFGLTSNIGFLNMNSSLGKSSLLNPLKNTSNFKDQSEIEPIINNDEHENEEFNIRKNTTKSVNEQFAQRLQNKGLNVLKKPEENEIEEIPSIQMNKPKNNNEKSNINTLTSSNILSSELKSPNQIIDNNNNNTNIDINKINSKQMIVDNNEIKKTEEDENNDKNNKLVNKIPENLEQDQNKNVNNVNNNNNRKSVVDENDPKIKLYNLVMSKDDLDNVNLKYFLYT